jgi:cell division protein ZapE
LGDSEDLRQRYHRELIERGFSADAAQLAAVERLEALRRALDTAYGAGGRPHRGWLGAFTRPKPVRGLYLWGAVGRGKTWLMDLFFAELPFAQRQRLHFHRFMREVHAQLAQLRGQPDPLAQVAARIAHDTRVLCFDELYVSDIADAMILGRLFAGLLRRAVTVVFTSNVPPRQLYRDGLQRARFIPAIRLLERQLEVLRLEGTTDHRLRRLTQAGTYLDALAPDTPARLAALFSSLADGGVRDGGCIVIEGRPVPVVRASHGAVWLEFTAACVGPRSQDDYIEIARAYHSVIVSGVPVFGPTTENEARRFAALVDEFYDRNVNLVLSAAAAPAELYRGEQLVPLFERTASRLLEMQSEAYLAREHKP